jgi:hypothetical protein
MVTKGTEEMVASEAAPEDGQSTVARPATVSRQSKRERCPSVLVSGPHWA